MSTYLIEFLKNAHQYISDSGKIPTHNDLLRSLYAAKIIDFYWFDGRISECPTAKIDYVRNPGGDFVLVAPESATWLLKLGEPELIQISLRLQLPKWMNPGLFFESMKNSELKSVWDNFSKPSSELFFE